MNKEVLGVFLIKSKREGYAAGNQTKEPDGSYSTRFEEGSLKFHDNWFGGEPFGGREIVFDNSEPYWMMVYYGEEFNESEPAIPTLQKALAAMPDDFPVRGPKVLEDGDLRYENEWEGDIEKFSGKERVLKMSIQKVIYEAMYMGGLVDQRKE